MSILQICVIKTVSKKRGLTMSFKGKMVVGAALVASFGMIIEPVNAVAKTKTYTRTKTTAVAKQTYYTTNATAHTYKANGNYSKWRFKANHDLKNYRNTIWTTTQKTYININGRKVLYYWVRNNKNNASGWIYSGYLKPITTYQRTKTTAIKATAFTTSNTTASTYRANGDLNYWTFKANHALKNYKGVTWTATQKTYITKHGKQYLYYWVHTSKNSASGWVYSGYLKSKSSSISISTVNYADPSVAALSWDIQVTYYTPKPEIIKDGMAGWVDINLTMQVPYEDTEDSKTYTAFTGIADKNGKSAGGKYGQDIDLTKTKTVSPSVYKKLTGFDVTQDFGGVY